MAIGGAGLGAILPAGGEYPDAANGLTVLTIHLGTTVGALYESAALVLAGPLMVPVAALLPAAVALVITLAGKRHAYPLGREELAGPSRKPWSPRFSTRKGRPACRPPF